MERQSIRKSQRFRIFTRDNFTCRYCGSQPPDVQLVIDHLIPVCDGGTNDDDNLIASCVECNQGKGSKSLPHDGPTAVECARIAQERLEQIDLAELAAQAAGARTRLRETVVNYLCSLLGCEDVHVRTVSSVCNLVHEFDPETVFGWLDSAVRITGVSSESDFLKYVCGIARNVRGGAQ